MSGFRRHIIAKLAQQEYIEGYCVVGTTSYSFSPTITGGSYDTITVYPDANGYWRWNVPKNYPISGMLACFTHISQEESDKLVSIKFHWDLTKGGNMSATYLFGSNYSTTSVYQNKCTNLKKVEGLQFKTSNISYMFYGCTSLEEVHITNIIQTTSTFYAQHTFSNCTNLKHIYGLENTTFTNMNAYYTFYYCESLEELNLGNWDMVRVQRFAAYCYKLKYVNRGGSTINIASDEYINYMFGYCYELEDIDGLLSSANCSIYCSYINGIFMQCYKLKSADLSGVTVQSNSTFNSMFYQCRNLEDVVMPDFSALDGVSVNLTSMFRECFSVKLNANTCPDFSNIIANRADYVFSHNSTANRKNWEAETGKTAFINMTHISIPTIPNGIIVSGFCQYATYATDVIGCGDISESMSFANNPFNLASAILILQHLQDVTSYGGKTITFSASTSALIQADTTAMNLVAQAQTNGWTITFN